MAIDIRITSRCSDATDVAVRAAPPVLVQAQVRVPEFRGELRDVMGADGGADLLVHGGDGFTSGGLAEIALAQKRHGCHDSSAEINDVVFARVTKDMHVEAFQQLARGVEVGSGVVVASGDDGLHRFEVGEPL